MSEEEAVAAAAAEAARIRAEEKQQAAAAAAAPTEAARIKAEAEATAAAAAGAEHSHMRGDEGERLTPAACMKAVEEQVDDRLPPVTDVREGAGLRQESNVAALKTEARGPALVEEQPSVA